MGFDNWKDLKFNLETEKEDRHKFSTRVLSYGIKFLDKITEGILPHDLILIGAKSGHGKSEMAAHIAMSNAKQGKRVFMFALEAEEQEIQRRLLFKSLVNDYYSDTHFNKIIPNYLRWYTSKQERELAPYYEHAKQSIKLNSLKIRYRGDEFGLEQYEQEIVGIKDQADLIILDHLHYMDFQGENENQALKNMIKTIRSLSLKHGVPVVVIGHIRKGNNEALVPSIEDFHGSSDIYKNATKVITLAPCYDHNEDPTKFLTYIRLAKCRQDGSRTRFVGLSAFDIKTNSYSDDFKLGLLSKGDKEWSEITTSDQMPHWSEDADL